MSLFAISAECKAFLIPSSLSLTASRIGFQANFLSINSKNKKVSTDQNISPSPGVTKSISLCVF
jgi:hypothetical protein